MKLLKYKEISQEDYTYYLGSDGNRVLHGEHKFWYSTSRLLSHCFWVNGARHGEYKFWFPNGELGTHCFYIHDKEIPVVDFKSDEEKLLFCLEHPDFRFIQ